MCALTCKRTYPTINNLTIKKLQDKIIQSKHQNSSMLQFILQERSVKFSREKNDPIQSDDTTEFMSLLFIHSLGVRIIEFEPTLAHQLKKCANNYLLVTSPPN